MGVSLLSALELDQKPMCNKFLLIEENATSDGSFLASTIVEEEIKRDHKIVLVLFHNSLGHLHGIGQKLGCNVFEQKELGHIVVFDFLKILMDRITTNEELTINKDLLDDLMNDIRGTVSSLCDPVKGDLCNATLIVDNIGNLLLLGFKLNIAVLFVQCLRTLLYEFKKFSIVCLTHNFNESSDSSMFTNHLRHMADLDIILDDLETGKAADVTGKLTVKWRTENLMQWKEASEYHYQLLDKKIIVFAPGTKNLL